MSATPRFSSCILAIGLAGLLPAAVAGQAPGEPVVHYRAQATVDADGRRLTGQLQIDWRNATAAPTAEILFQSAGAVTIASLAVDSGRGPTDARQRTVKVPQAGGATGAATVWSLPLDEPVRPGQHVHLDVGWTAEIPARDASRAPSAFVVGTDWYPRVGMLGPSGWAPRQAPVHAESVGPIANFDVTLRAPSTWTIASSGRTESRTDHGDGTASVRFAARAARDFAWAGGSAVVERTDRWSAAGDEPVTVRVVVQHQHRDQADRQIAAAKSALAWYGLHVGPFPWDTLTLVDVSTRPWSLAQQPVAYAGLVTFDTRWFSPWSGPDPEAAIVRGMAEIYARTWPGPDTVRDPWLGQDLASYLAGAAFEGTFGGRSGRVERYFNDVVTWAYADVRWHRLLAPPERGAQALFAVERLLGWDTARAILARHVMRRSDTPVGPAEFLATANSTAGRDVSRILSAFTTSSASFDYAVAQVRPRTADDATSAFVVSREADGVFPVDILVTFADGASLVERWDGQERDRRFEYHDRAAISRVDIDPNRVLVADTNRLNNSWTGRSSATAAATRWTTRWVLWVQHLLVTYAAFV